MLKDALHVVVVDTRSVVRKVVTASYCIDLLVVRLKLLYLKSMLEKNNGAKTGLYFKKR